MSNETALWDTAIRTMRWTPILAVPFLELFSYSLVDQYPGVQGYNPPFHNNAPKPSSSEAAKEAFWLRQLMCGLKQDVSLPTPLFIDNRGAQLLAKNQCVWLNALVGIIVRQPTVARPAR